MARDKDALPWYITLAFRVVRDYFDQDLGTWPPAYRTRVLVAALDAEPLGERAVKLAAHDTAKVILAEWKGQRAVLHRRRDEGGRI